MATKKDLIARIGAEDANFTATLAKARREAEKFRTDLESIGRKLTVGVTAPLAGLGALAIRQFGEMDALERALSTVAGSARETQRQLAALRETAKLPGLGLEEAVRGSIALQQVGYSADKSRKLIELFGNALASAGRGREDLGETVRQLQQLGASGKVTAENLKPIIERVPQVAGIIKKEFGTLDTEALQKLGVSSKELIAILERELGKLPKVTGGIKNDLENFRDAANRALGGIGQAIAPGATALINSLTPAIEKLGEMSKSFAENATSAQKTATAMGLIGLAATGPILLAVTQTAKLAKELRGLSDDIAKSALFRGALSKLSSVSGAALAGAGAVGVGTFFALDRLNQASTGADTSARKLDSLRTSMTGLTKEASKFRDVSALADSIARFGKGEATDAIEKFDRITKQKEIKLPKVKVEKLEGLQDFLADLERLRRATEVEQEFFALQRAAQAVADGTASLMAPIGELESAIAILGQNVPTAEQSITRLDTALANLATSAGIQQFREQIEKDLSFSISALETAFGRLSNIRPTLPAVGVLGQIDTAAQDAAIKSGSRQFENLKEKATEFGRQASLVLTDFSRSIVDAITRAKTLGEAMRGIALDIAKSITRYAIEGGVKLLGKEILGVLDGLGNIGDKLRSVLGIAANAGDAVKPATDAAGNTVRAAGGALSGALSGWVGAISSSISAAMDIWQVTQLRRIEQDVGRIEVTSRGMLNQLISIQNSMNQWLPKLDGLSGGAIPSGTAEAPWQQSLAVILERINNALTLGGGIPAGGGSATTIIVQNMVVQASDPRGLVDAIGRELRLRTQGFA